MCSDPGQNLIRHAIKEKKLTGAVVAACSPRMHEPTFRRTCSRDRIESVPLRDGEPARALFLGTCQRRSDHGESRRSRFDDGGKSEAEKPLLPIKVPVTKTALVIGAALPGIQAALDIANAGQKVVMVEHDPSIGGHMSQLSETFPTSIVPNAFLRPGW